MQRPWRSSTTIFRPCPAADTPFKAWADSRRRSRASNASSGSTIATVWNNHGICLSMVERFQDALKSLERSLKLDPARASTWSNQGETLFLMGHHKDALASFEQALARDQRLGSALYGKARSLFGLEDHNFSG